MVRKDRFCEKLDHLVAAQPSPIQGQKFTKAAAFQELYSLRPARSSRDFESEAVSKSERDVS